MARLIPLLCLLFLAACATPMPPAPWSPAEHAVVDAMARRLEIAREVAWIKYLDQSPVRDPEREAAVIEEMVTAGSRRSLDAEWVRQFFTAQIAASCAEQTRLMKWWSRGNPLPTHAPRSLAHDIRPEINAVDRELIAALGRLSGSAGFRARAMAGLQARGIRPEVARLATAPL